MTVNPGIISENTIQDRVSQITPKGRATDKNLIVQLLEGYRTEAEYARMSGPNSRDQTWLMHLDLYWNRYDYSKKAPWQAREVMPELPQYVDRFAAAVRTALVSSERFFTVTDNNDAENDLADVVKKILKVQMRRVGRNATGHPIDFLNVFEDLMKMGALMMPAAVVIPKTDQTGQSYVAIDQVDPYNIWFDPTGRNLYRIRRIETDMNELKKMAKEVDGKGMSIYDQEEISNCTAEIIALMRAEREKRTGTGQWMQSTRRPVVLHEYYCTIIDDEGDMLAQNVLCVVANNRWLIRGPEVNPFWHSRDWLLASPVITVPMSPYGRSYVENFSSLARTFNEMTNLLLDSAFTSAMKAFAAVPSLLENPMQLDEGIYPNVTFKLLDGVQPGDFIKEISLGQVGQDAFQIWTALKGEMQEGAAFNSLTLGQLAPHSRTSAMEIGTADTNANSYMRSIASNIETLFLEPLLDLVWHTTVQMLSAKDKEIEDAVGPDWFQAILSHKKQFAKYKFTFCVRGISSLVLKAQKLQQLMQLLQIAGSNQLLGPVFAQEISPQKLLNMLYDLLDIEKDRIIPTPREKMMMQLNTQAQQMMQMAQAGGVEGPPGQASPPGPQGPPQPAMGPGPGQAIPAGAGVPAASQNATPQPQGGP